MDLDKKYNLWLEKQEFDDIDEKELKEELTKELTFMSSMTVEEYTLFRKWREISLKYPPKKTNPFLFSDTSYPELERIKKNIWVPESINDYKKLQPVPKSTRDNKILAKDWGILRTFISTMINNPSIGRNIRYVIVDEITEKYLGVICFHGDYLDLKPRDDYIGWSRESKTNEMIKHTGAGITIVPTQPLGYNYLGGKLLSLLLISNIIEEDWNNLYPEKLVAITTTSLYGTYSQYNSLKHWNKRGKTSGSTKYEPSKKSIMKVRQWLKKNHTRKYWEWYHALNTSGLPLKRDHKQRSLTFTYSKLGIDKKLIETSHSRGVYFCPLFTNACEFLRKEITEDKLVRRFDNSLNTLVDLWKNKYAKKRVESIKEITEPLFYNDIIGKSWEETKEMYLKEVGR